MKHMIVLLGLCLSAKLQAQDRIITISQDTLKAKVSNIDKQKVVYYLEADKDKKLSELPISGLHKIIWRSGLEYVINQEIEAKLKKETKPAPVIAKQEPEQPKPIEEKKQEIKTTEPSPIVNAPALRVRRWGLWRTYTVNDRRVSPDEMENTLYKHDLEGYENFNRGNGIRYKGRKMSRIATTTSLAALLIPVPILAVGISLGADVVGCIGAAKYIKGRKIMRKAVLAYEKKRTTNTIKPRFAQNNK
jgi:hypothetical protein